MPNSKQEWKQSTIEKDVFEQAYMILFTALRGA